MMINHNFYKKAYEKHNTSAKALHWASKESQEKRFEVLLSFIKEDLENSTLVDAGCGYGHLIEYFNKVKLFPQDYLGLDCEEFMIDIAKKNNPKFEFRTCNIIKEPLPKRDYYFCSGAMNILPKKLVSKFIKNCFNASKKGYIFNFITNNIFETDKKYIIDFCESLTERIEIKEEYIKNDFSIFMKK